MAYRPETAEPLAELTEVLLRGPSTLTRGERELIATYVSYKNGCEFCWKSHAAFARRQLENGSEVVQAVLADHTSAPISPKLKALLQIARAVASSPPTYRTVHDNLIQQARAQGATDRELHDTVLIAAAFCMFNRYVDGLATVPAKTTAEYDELAAHITDRGYTVHRSRRPATPAPVSGPPGGAP